LTRTFTRVFARARIPLKYSQGFHPTPLISFGPALPVGMESAEEWMDFETIIKVPSEELLERLNKQLPEDLQFITIREVDPHTPALFNLISAAEYSVSLDKPEIDEAVRATLNGTSADLSRAEMHAKVVENFLSQEKILITRIRKENEKQIDIRPLVKLVEVQNGSQPLSLRLILGAGSSGTLRPEEFLETMYKLPREHFRIRRERQMTEHGAKLISPL
jgi:radical SAM-linked protein